MRNEQFESALRELWTNIVKCLSEEKLKNPTKRQIVVCALAQKCLSHCEMALKLVIANALMEAAIILRAAYEAAIRAIYLDENPDKITDYEAFAALTTLRNQLEVLKLLDESGEAYEGKQEQERLINAQCNKIIANGYHARYNLRDDQLRNWQAVKAVTNRSNLPNFEDVRNRINKTSFTKALLSVGFQIYNVGSQIAHSSLEMVTAYSYYGSQHPLYTEDSAYRLILLLMMGCSKSLTSCGAITEMHQNLLERQHQRIARDFLKP